MRVRGAFEFDWRDIRWHDWLWLLHPFGGMLVFIATVEERERLRRKKARLEKKRASEQSTNLGL